MHAHVVHTYLTPPSMWNFNNTSEYHASVHFRSQRGSWTILTTFSLPLMAKNLLNWGPPVNKGNKTYFQNFDKIQKNVITVIFYLRINKTSTLWFGDVVAWCREVFNAPFTGKVGVFSPLLLPSFSVGAWRVGIQSGWRCGIWSCRHPWSSQRPHLFQTEVKLDWWHYHQGAPWHTRIAGNFGGDFNLAVWRIVRTSPNLNPH